VSDDPDYYRKLYIADERIKRLEQTEVHYRLQEQYIEELEQCIRVANDRIKLLEDRIERASAAFFHDGTDRQTAAGMPAILEEERNKP